MAAGPATRIQDYLAILATLARGRDELIIVGGQAVNLWAELFLNREPSLAAFLPFTSRDLDLYRSGKDAQLAIKSHGFRTEKERDPFGKAFDLVEAVFTIVDKAGRELRIESLKALGGLAPREVKQGIVEIDYEGLKLNVLNPIRLLQAKAHNLVHLDQENRQDEKHYCILLLCVRAFLAELLERSESKKSTRELLDFLEESLRLTLHPEVLGAGLSRHFDLKEILPLNLLEKSSDPTIVRFMTHRLPRWEASLRSKIAKLRQRNDPQGEK